MDETVLNNRPTALGGRFLLFFMLVMLFVSPLKVPLVNAKNMQLRRRLEKFLIFCLKII